MEVGCFTKGTMTLPTNNGSRLFYEGECDFEATLEVAVKAFGGKISMRSLCSQETGGAGKSRLCDCLSSRRLSASAQRPARPAVCLKFHRYPTKFVAPIFCIAAKSSAEANKSTYSRERLSSRSARGEKAFELSQFELLVGMFELNLELDFNLLQANVTGRYLGIGETQSMIGSAEVPKHKALFAVAIVRGRVGFGIFKQIKVLWDYAFSSGGGTSPDTQ